MLNKLGDIGSLCFAFTLEFCRFVAAGSPHEIHLFPGLGSSASVEDLYIRWLGVSHFLVAHLKATCIDYDFENFFQVLLSALHLLCGV